MRLIEVGSRVVFDKKVFRPPYAPYYDDYKGHVFTVKKLHYRATHVELTCEDDPSVKVKGFVHPDELEQVPALDETF